MGTMAFKFNELSYSVDRRNYLNVDRLLSRSKKVKQVRDKNELLHNTTEVIDRKSVV